MMVMPITTPPHSPEPMVRQMTNMEKQLEYESRLQPTDDNTLRYLQFECTYRSCKYQDPLWTWGQLVKEDYDHFIELMKDHVPLGSKTFDALKDVLVPADLVLVENHRTCFINSDEQKAKTKERYLNMLCTHNGRMKNKPWGTILKYEYNYFMWAVGNTMGRETRTFNSFVECLKPADKEVVLATPKGQVELKRKKSV
jgi:hypothetical protein